MATVDFGTYSLDEVSCLIGTYPFDAYGENGAIRWEANSSVFDEVVGHDGKVIRYKTLDDSAKVTITLLQSSAGNDVLSTLLNLDRNAPNGAGVLPFFMNDRSGRTVIQAPKCYVKGWPAVSRERKAVSYDWVIQMPKARVFVGGH